MIRLPTICPSGAAGPALSLDPGSVGPAAGADPPVAPMADIVAADETAEADRHAYKGDRSLSC